MNSPLSNQFSTDAKDEQSETRRKSSAHIFVTFLLCVGLTAMAATLYEPHQRSDAQTAKVSPSLVDINEADWISFSQLERIGPTLAFRIVANREHFGPFPTIDDLLRVEGIGPLTLDRIRYRLTIGHDQLKLSKQQREPKQ